MQPAASEPTNDAVDPRPPVPLPTRPSSDAPLQGSLMGAGSGWREAFFGFGCGVLYGMTSPLIGHPFDTVKTKMQAQVRA